MQVDPQVLYLTLAVAAGFLIVGILTVVGFDLWIFLSQHQGEACFTNATTALEMQAEYNATPINRHSWLRGFTCFNLGELGGYQFSTVN